MYPVFVTHTPYALFPSKQAIRSTLYALLETPMNYDMHLKLYLLAKKEEFLCLLSGFVLCKVNAIERRQFSERSVRLILQLHDESVHNVMTCPACGKDYTIPLMNVLFIALLV